MTLTVRLATQVDAAVISALNADVQQLHAGAEPGFFKPPSDSTFPAALVKSLMANPDTRFCLAFVDSKPAGYLYATIRRRADTPMTYPTTWVYVEQISVSPAFQHMGCGEALMDAAKAWAREEGISTVALDTWAFNTQAQRFFAKQGFVPFNIRMWTEV